MKKHIFNIFSGVILLGMFLSASYLCNTKTANAANPYLPLWEHIPDGEPYVFEDPDEPGEYRLYIYGSHDTFKNRYCGDDLVVWSAPVDDLTDWRYDGVIFSNNGNTLFAPDIAVKENPDGTKTYYLYPNNQNNMGMIAKSDSPKGPFKVCATNGVLGFDPAVFVDDDGRVYGYWGFESSNMAELDPNTMCTVKNGSRVLNVNDTKIDGSGSGGPFRFFEASSIRKVTDNGQTKYVFVYSRMSINGEKGLGGSNATLAYAYSDNPLGPWTYGGFLVDARAREEDEKGNTIQTFQSGNTHGSIVKVKDQWYVFYHRCINNDQYSRQGTAEAIDLHITDDGKVVIEEPEVTSEGLEINGLNPYKKTTAGLMCYRIGSSTVKATYDKNDPGSPVVDNRNGGIIGFKYFNFQKKDWQNTEFALSYLAKGIDGSVEIMLDSPWESKGGIHVGSIEISKDDSTREHTTKTIEVPEIDKVSGKHALYFVFKASSNANLLDMKEFEFILNGTEPEPTAIVTPTQTPEPVSTPEPTATPEPQTPTEEPVKISNFTAGGLKFKVTKEGSEVSVAGLKNKKAKMAVIPAKIVFEEVTYRVTGIEKKAFRNCKKLRKIIVRTKELKKVGKNCFRGIDKNAVIKVPKTKLREYKKLFKRKGQKKRVKIK